MLEFLRHITPLIILRTVGIIIPSNSFDVERCAVCLTSTLGIPVNRRRQSTDGTVPPRYRETEPTPGSGALAAFQAGGPHPSPFHTPCIHTDMYTSANQASIMSATPASRLAICSRNWHDDCLRAGGGRCEWGGGGGGGDPPDGETHVVVDVPEHECRPVADHPAVE